MGGTLVVARVASAHGIRGELFLRLETDHPRDLFQPGARLTVEGVDGPTALTVRSARPHRKGWLILTDEIVDRSAADRLRGAWLAVPEDMIPDLAPGEFFLHDLPGLLVVTDSGDSVGVITDVLDFPAGPMLVVDDDGRERLIPLQTGLVTRVAVDEGRVRINPPEGLLDL